VRLHRKLFPWTLLVVLCGGLGIARADGTPNITALVSAANVLYGAPVHVSVTAANPPGTYGYNLTYRVVLPVGVTYGGGAPTAPTAIANAPLAGQTTLIFSNVSDLSPNSRRAIASRPRRHAMRRHGTRRQSSRWPRARSSGIAGAAALRADPSVQNAPSVLFHLTLKLRSE
jgi:hypothetical protein